MKQINEYSQKILIVDDDPGDLMLISVALRDAGFSRIHRLGLGVDISDEVQRLSPDVIILDVLMPKINGMMLSNLLKSKESTRSIPIVFVSGLLNEDHVESNADGVIVGKSITYKGLIATVQTCIKEKSAC